MTSNIFFSDIPVTGRCGLGRRGRGQDLPRRGHPRLGRPRRVWRDPVHCRHRHVQRSHAQHQDRGVVRGHVQGRGRLLQNRLERRCCSACAPMCAHICTAITTAHPWATTGVPIGALVTCTHTHASVTKHARAACPSVHRCTSRSSDCRLRDSFGGMLLYRVRMGDLGRSHSIVAYRVHT